MRSLAVAVVILTFAGVARAEPAPADDKSVSTALELSIGTTALGVAALAGTAATSDSKSGARYPLFAFGSLALLAGPSIGRIYAGHIWNGGQAVRIVGFGVMVMGEALASSCLGEERPAHGPSDCGAAKITAGPILAGGAVMLLGALFEIPDTVGDVEEHNRGSFVPAPVITPSGTAPGLAFAGRF